MNRRWGLAFVALCVGCHDSSTMHDANSDSVNTLDASDVDDFAAPDDGSTPPARDLTVHASGFASYQSLPWILMVVDSTGFTEMGAGLVGSLHDDAFDVRMPALLPEGDFHLDAYVDANRNGRYDGPAIDHSWRWIVPSQGSATVSAHATDSVTDLSMMAASPQLDAVLSLAGFTPQEVGQRFELRVTDASSGASVGAYLLPQLASASLSFTLAGAVQSGNGYQIDFWSDVDGDGTYSGPGADHTWRVMADATSSGLAITWTHDTNYVELDWQ
jgi:hypothetical protein